MTDPVVYLEKLALFSEYLRAEGLPVGPQETADAARAIVAVGADSREMVRAALMTVYAKSREETLTFHRAFDSFFVPEDVMRKQAEEQAKQQMETDRAREQAQRELERQGGPSDLTEDQLTSYLSMPDEMRKRLREITDKYQPKMNRAPKLYSGFIRSVFMRAILEQQMQMEDAGLGGDEADPDEGLLYRDISTFQDTEIPTAAALIQNISAKISGELSKKKKRAGHSGALDFRRTIRKGLETGGSFYTLKYRKKRQRKRHLVLLADVSGSMIQFSEFTLRFILGMAQISESSRVFLFSETVFEADPFALENMDAFRGYVRKSGLYGRGTDLGSALTFLNELRPPALSDASTLLILSDGRTVDQMRAVDSLLESKRLAGQVLWLNPIPESKWNYLSSTRAFASVTTMLPCSTLHDLAAACRRLDA